PSRRWLGVHYGVAALVTAIALVPLGAPTRFDVPIMGLLLAYCATMLVLTVRAVRRLARRGNWPRTYRLVHGVVPAAAVAGLGVFAVAAGLGLTQVILRPVTTGDRGHNPFRTSILAHTALRLALPAPV